MKALLVEQPLALPGLLNIPLLSEVATIETGKFLLGINDDGRKGVRGPRHPDREVFCTTDCSLQRHPGLEKLSLWTMG